MILQEYDVRKTHVMELGGHRGSANLSILPEQDIYAPPGTLDERVKKHARSFGAVVEGQTDVVDFSEVRKI